MFTTLLFAALCNVKLLKFVFIIDIFAFQNQPTFPNFFCLNYALVFVILFYIKFTLDQISVLFRGHIRLKTQESLSNLILIH